MKLRMIALLVAFSITALFAEKIVTPNKDGVGVYKNEIRELYEKPLFTVGTSDRLSILDSKGNFHKIKSTGQVGWVEKSNVQATGRSRTFVFDNAEVVGYLDNPTPVYIMDTDDPNADPINLDRSFKDALRENVDKETVERQVK